MSAFTFSEVTDTDVGRARGVDAKGRRSVRGTLTGPSSYDTGGSTLPAASLPFREVVEMHVVAPEGASATVNHDGHAVVLIPGVPGKVKVFTNLNAEVAGATNLTGSSFLVEIYGK